MRWRRAIASSFAMAAFAVGCGVDTGIRGVPVIPVGARFVPPGAETRLESRMPGLWREDRAGLAHYYWFKPDGTGERLRRSLDPAGPREPIPQKFTWTAAEHHLELKFDDQPGAFAWQLLDDDRRGDRITLTSPWKDETAWFGCASGRIPSEYVALCGR